jgi:ferredoxin
MTTSVAPAIGVTPTRVDSSLLTDIQRFGAADVTACFSCGVCSATCPLVSDDSTFPRRMIRFAQLGLRDRLLSSRELWTCYACGECSESCPQQAEPGEFMAAARRYAIASYDRTHLAGVLSTRPVVATLIAVVLALFLAAFMYTAHGPQGGASLDLFAFIPEDVIHTLGIAVMAVVGLTGLLAVVTMTRALARSAGIRPAALVGSRAALRRSIVALWTALAVESLGQRRYREDCETEDRPWYRRRWFIHAATMWGFLGLLAATILDYGLALLDVKPTGTPVPIWEPIRLLGTVAGALLLYGTTYLIVRRARAEERSLRHSTIADWMLLTLLWLAGATGFALEAALYLPGAPAWGYWVFLLHVAVAMELVLLAPVTKFAHVAFRPIALYFLALSQAPLPAPRAVGEEAAVG